jgi:hypothetical protein
MADGDYHVLLTVPRSLFQPPFELCRQGQLALDSYSSLNTNLNSALELQSGTRAKVIFHTFRFPAIMTIVVGSFQKPIEF